MQKKRIRPMMVKGMPKTSMILVQPPGWRPQEFMRIGRIMAVIVGKMVVRTPASVSALARRPSSRVARPRYTASEELKKVTVTALMSRYSTKK